MELPGLRVSCKNIMSTGSEYSRRLMASFFPGLASPLQLKDRIFMEGEGMGRLLL